MILTVASLLIILITCGEVQEQNVYPFQENEKWGYKDNSGTIVIKAGFLLATHFTDEGIAAVVDDTGWVYINKKGDRILRPFIVDNGPDYFKEGLARFDKNGKIGFFNKKGHIVIPARYEFVRSFSQDRAAFCTGCKKIKEGEYYRMTGGKWGYIDRYGHIVIEAQYETVTDFSVGRAEVVIDSTQYYIDLNGGRLK